MIVLAILACLFLAVTLRAWRVGLLAATVLLVQAHLLVRSTAKRERSARNERAAMAKRLICGLSSDELQVLQRLANGKSSMSSNYQDLAVAWREYLEGERTLPEPTAEESFLDVRGGMSSWTRVDLLRQFVVSSESISCALAHDDRQ